MTTINSAEASDLTNAMTDYSVDTKETDGANEYGETRWEIENWSKYFGYYKTIPELRAVIDAKATWTIGKGFESDEITEMILDNIKGWGADTFNTILENMIRTMQISGDSFAEIIKDEHGDLINLKPLDPSVMVIITNPQGVIKRYEQNSKTEGKKAKRFETKDIFHLARNRVADEIHGVSLVEALEWTILAKNESMADMKTLMHRHVHPRWIFHLDTDDETEIADFKVKQDKANANGENMYIPKDVVVPELQAVAPNATLNPLPWQASLNNMFYQISQTPQIILGGSGEFTEASAKIAYLAFQQTIEEDQLYIMEQVLSQLNKVILLQFPASLENELLSDNRKDGMESENPQGINPSETTAGEGQ